MLAESKTSQIYKYHTIENKWLVSPENAEIISPPISFSILTLNVLFDEWWGKPYKPHVVRPKERYQHQFKTMEAADCDIITLNEVTANYIALIIKEKWVQEKYYISDISGATINGFGNLVLSKFPISELHLIKLSELKRPIVCVKIPFDKNNLIIAATHLSAQKENHEKRQVQIKELTAFLDHYFPANDKMILGDVNYHTEDEIVPPNYIDSWKVVHPSLPGNTFDGTINTMLHEMWPFAWIYGFDDKIKMRLDRVFIQMKDWTPSEMEICFNEPVYEAKRRANIFKDVLSILFDKLGVNIARNPKHYLFPSDHFGLITRFEKIDI